MVVYPGMSSDYMIENNLEYYTVKGIDIFTKVYDCELLQFEDDVIELETKQ